MTMYGTLHPISGVDRLYFRRKEGGRSLMSVECCVREEENNLFFFFCQFWKINLIKGFMKPRQSIRKIL